MSLTALACILACLVHAPVADAFNHALAIGTARGKARSCSPIPRSAVSPPLYRPTWRTLLQAAANWQEATDSSTGQKYYWNTVTGETAWTLPDDSSPTTASVPGADISASKAPVLCTMNVVRVSKRVSSGLRNVGLWLIMNVLFRGDCQCSSPGKEQRPRSSTSR